jgi:hypothetical protein
MGLVGILLAVGAVSAQESAVRQDANAIEVLKSMSAYTASLDRFMIGGVTLTDARLGEGLMVSNSVEVKASSVSTVWRKRNCIFTMGH